VQILKTSLNKISEEEINIIVDSFLRGMVVAYPTDTIYGLGCVATDKDAVKKVYKAKKREKDKPLIILVKSYCMLKKYCFVSKRQDEYLRKVWAPGEKPTTVILKHRGLLPEELTGSLDSVAVRLPQNEFLVKIIKKINFPIASTSLNISGGKEISDLKDMNKNFGKNSIDLVVDVGQSFAQKPSRIVDIRDINEIKIIRK